MNLIINIDEYYIIKNIINYILIMRNITNINDILSSRSIDNGGDINQLTADLPLNIILDDTTNDSINLGGLNSYGTTGQVIKMNSNADGLVYANETDTTYTNGTNITISAQNVISSDQKTTLTFNTSQKLKGTGSGSSIRDIAYVDSNNDIIFGDSQNNCGFSVSTGIYFLGDGTPLISNLRVFNSSGLNNTGNINNLSGNINLTNENKLNFNNDANNSIGSQNALNGVELKGFNNVLIKTSVTNKPSINVGQTAIKCKGKISGEFLTGTTERDLLQLTQNDSIQLGDANTNMKYVCSAGGGLYINSVTNPVLTGTGTANLQGLSMDAGDIDIVNGDINMINGKNIIFNGMTDNLNFIGSSTVVNGVYLQGSNIVKMGTQGGNASAILTIQQTKINFKGKITGQYTYNGTERDLLQLTQNESIQLGDANTNMKYVCSAGGGLYINSVVNPVLSGDGTANLQGLKLDAGDINMSCPNKINFNSDIYNYIHCDNNIGGTGWGGVQLIGYNAVKIGTSAGNTASFVINGQKLQLIGDLHTSNDIYCDAKYRILSASPFLPFPETIYDNYINYGVAYATGPDIHGYRGVKLWARDATNNVDDIRFYVSAGVCNMRVPTALVNGQVVQTSDDRLKTDEIDFTFNSLDILNRMKPKQYKKYNEDGEFLYMELGMVAQETWNSVKDIELLRDIFVNKIDYNLESNFKENGDLIEDQQKTNDKGEIETNYLYVNYISYVPILIQSVKDLNSIVKQQQDQINQQQTIIDKLVNSTSYKNFKSSI